MTQLPIPEMLLNDRNRFWSRVQFASENDCWLWVGASNCEGKYGRFSIHNKMYLVNRVSYYLAYGEPGSYLVCHECNNTKCVNPKHLYLGSTSDNMVQCVLDGRLCSSLGGEFATKALFYDADVVKIRERHANGESQGSIARSLAVGSDIINRIVNRKTYRYAELSS